ncbi:aminopeptidase N [Actinomadura algeriensis]|uniref:Aminopeptidase N n=1 Tax=Actinomadura algeriensis TaxID=1679523 RepID=A0ABR9JI99_9ACTN|nr:aminopeptidase N [Actinomadura algeriensis]MBE1530284.1 aminopeptidase N [Actinomadura algeriensis]
MAGNLTRDEARERARLLTVESYAVELDLTTGEERFGSTTVIRFGGAEPGASTFVDLHGAVVREATLNGVALDPSSYDADKGRLPLPGLAAENELRVVADCAYSRSGEGLHRFVDPVDGGVYLYSQFETADAHRMYTCFDQPDLKATFEFTVRAPEDWEVVTNEAAEKREGGDWHFMPTPQISTYITALIAGPYHVVRDEHRREDGTVIPLGVYCRASLAEHLDAPAIVDVTRQGFEYFERVFGRPYPFAKYDQLFVPEFNAGAMENAGAVTFLEDYVFRSRVTDAAYERRAETILHEMAHMWFGDLVTMRWWDDLWLNESFATYMSVLCQSEATKWTSSWTTFANLMKAWAYRQDQLPSTHPISADIPDIRAVEVNFDGITYAKGASVLKQLVAYVGRDNFLEGVRRYFDRHAWGNTVLTDLLEPLAETSGREDLAAWSKEWLETAGVNTLRPHYEVDQDGNFASFAVLQEAKADYPTLRSHRVAIGLYDRTPEGIVRRERVELDVRGARTEVPELAGRKRPDLVLVNDDDLTYAKVRLDDHSLSTLVDGIGDIKEGLPRALCWSAAWDMTRDAEMATRDYVRLVAKGIRGVTDISVTQTLLRQARLAVQQYADPAWRDEGLALLADTLSELAREAEPGSDFQLAYVQAFAGSAVTDAHLSFVRGLLDGSRKLDGLTVDTDLRWTLLRRLVVTGKAGQSEIDAEHERDRTAAGERHAAACTAAIPSADAKAAAWERIVSGDLPNAVYRATLGGFVEPDQADLLVPYVDRYFAEVGRVWKEWSSDMSQTFAENAYPFLVIEQSTIDRTEAYIEENTPPAALVRLLSEGRDGVARALRARAQDASAS